MQKTLRIQFLLLFNILINTNLYSQIHTTDTTQIDSAEFWETRKIMDKLPVIKFERKLFQRGTTTIPYRFLFPKGLNASEKYPLIITFHNSSRVGNDNEKQLEYLAKIWLREDIYNNYRCFVLAPQFNKRSSNYQENNEGVLVSAPSHDAHQILALINEVENKYPSIDKNRIYLVGYSMGASTAQNIISIEPNKFAALVSIAAVPDFSNLKKLKKKNIWLIHGEKDNENPYEGSKQLYERLFKSKNLVFSTFTNLKHNNIVTPFLLTDEIPKWLFEKHK